VTASVLGGLIVFGVLAAIPTLDWLQPDLLTIGWTAGADALLDPLPFADLALAPGPLLLRDRLAWPCTGCCAGTPGCRTLHCKHFHPGCMKLALLQLTTATPVGRMLVMAELLSDSAISAALTAAWKREGDAIVRTASSAA
jgi:hypothetical protein